MYTIGYDLSLELMGYLIPVTPQAFVNRISPFVVCVLYQLYLHFTIHINIYTP